MDDRLTQRTSGQDQSRREKLLWDDRVEGSAGGGVAVSPKAHSSSSVETSKRSFVDQEGLLPMPKDRGAVQGNVDGPLECSLPLGMVAAEVRGNIAASHAAGTFLWIGENDSAEVQRLHADYAARLQESANFQLGGPENRTCGLASMTRQRCSVYTQTTQQEYKSQPTFSLVARICPLAPTTRSIRCRKMEAWQPSGTWTTATSRAARSWCCLSCRIFDAANVRVGAERNHLKTQVIHCVTELECSTAQVEN